MGVVTILTDCDSTSNDIRNIMYKFIPRKSEKEYHWIRTVNLFSSPIDDAIIKQGMTYRKEVNDFEGGQVIYLSKAGSRNNLTHRQIEYIKKSLANDNILFSTKLFPEFIPVGTRYGITDLCKKYCMCLSETCAYCGINCSCNKKGYC